MMPRLARFGAGRPGPAPDRVATMRSGPADPAHRARAAAARRADPGPAPGRAPVASEPAVLPGDLTRDWLDDLVRRGPFRHAALLGGSPLAERWLRGDASPRLDVYSPSLAALTGLRHRLGPVLHRARLARADLDFLVLPRLRYDVVWSDDALRDVVNLEYVLDEIAAALRPGGLFAYRGYVAERRQRYTAARRARLEAALREIPARWRPAGLESPAAIPREAQSPLCAVRSDEILPLARARFEVVREVRGGALFPIAQELDLTGLGREAPEIAARLNELEVAGRDDRSVAPALAYVVLRKPA
jgi:SAM-dependent methyltransferase